MRTIPFTLALGLVACPAPEPERDWSDPPSATSAKLTRIGDCGELRTTLTESFVEELVS